MVTLCKHLQDISKHSFQGQATCHTGNVSYHSSLRGSFSVSKIEIGQRSPLLAPGQLVDVECFVLKHSSEVCHVGRQVPLYLFTEARVVRRLQIRIILSRAIHHMSIGDVQQVPQPAAPVMPALIADAIFQDYVVSAEGP